MKKPPKAQLPGSSQAPIIDRTLHHGEYLKLSGSSYRLRGRKLDLDPPQSTAFSAPTT